MTALPNPADSLQASHRFRAQLLRKVSASTGLTRTMRKAVRVLAEANIPSLVVGGYAVQERGYPRFTSDVDIVVPNIAEAREVLSIRGFHDSSGRLKDDSSSFCVMLLQGGTIVGSGPLPLPRPRLLSLEPVIVDLATLIEIKLSLYLPYRTLRMRDLADVIELIKANKTPRDLPLASEVVATYRNTWDGLAAESAPIHPAP